MFHSLRSRFRGEVETSPFMRRCYAGAAGIYTRRPRAVAFPADEADVAAALELCRQSGLPLTARGAGSGMVGNNVGRGLVLDFTRHWRHAPHVEEGSGTVTAPPGLTYEALNAFLRPLDRFLPPNPSSGRFCTLGGMVASNASGMRSVRYGPTAAWVVGARGFWGTGERFDVERTSESDGRQRSAVGVDRMSGDRRQRTSGADSNGADHVLAGLHPLFRRELPPAPRWLAAVLKNSAGLRVWPAWRAARVNPVELLAGSEGTLGIFTELTFRTAPLPGGRALLLVSLPTLDSLPVAVDLARAWNPSGLEFLDRTFVEPLRSAGGAAARAIPARTEAVLFVELEAESSAAAGARAGELLRELEALALERGRVAETPEQMDALWQLRRGASPSLARRHPGRVPLQFVEDCAVPPTRLPDLLKGLRTIFAEEDVPVVLFGHAGEAHVHANPLFDVRDSRLGSRVERVAEKVCDLIEGLDGTLSGEHGDGLARAAFAERRFGPAAAFFRRVQRICDPAGILNPGSILPEPGWSTGSDLRHLWERRLHARRELPRRHHRVGAASARHPRVTSERTG